MEQKTMCVSGKREQQCQAVDEMAQRYMQVITGNYQRQEKELLQQLFDQTKTLKQEIAFFKRKVSQESIQKLIGERRREKEKERQQLQTSWRECNQSFKALQEEQKTLTSQQRENSFDLQNLQKKIDEFRVHIINVKDRIVKLEDSNSNNFITQIKENYHSPYRNAHNIAQFARDHFQRGQKVLAETQQLFFSTKYTSGDSQLVERFLNTSNFSNGSTLGKIGSSLRKGTNASRFSDVPGIDLRSFFDNPQVRAKLFKVINKQL